MEEYTEPIQDAGKLIYDTSGVTGVEDEEVTNAEETDIEPYNPEELSIDTRPFVMDALLRRLKLGMIVLHPNFQRNEVWTQEKNLTIKVEWFRKSYEYHLCQDTLELCNQEFARVMFDALSK